MSPRSWGWLVRIVGKACNCDGGRLEQQLARVGAVQSVVTTVTNSERENMS